MGEKVVCVSCCEYKQCFKIAHRDGKEQFNVCFQCAYSFEDKDVWREVKNERKEQNV